MTYCGVVSIAGRPNVGKSTLLNKLIGQKLSITAHKPQTTRHSIHGIHTEGERQIIYVDTPGIHVSGTQKLNQVLNRTASSSLHDVDVVILLLQAMVWNEDDQRAYELVSNSGVPFFIAINKIMLISARKGSGVDALVEGVGKLIPEAPWQFGADELTNRSSRFLASEAVREQLTRLLSAELPYALSVEIETFEESKDLLRIGAVIWVDKASQKGIVIGKGGAQLKEVGTRARATMETLFDNKVFLQLWVRVKEGWADDDRALRSLGYESP
jgi:GTP-binding protein Era